MRVAAISRRTPVMRANEPKGLDWRLVIDGVLWKRLFRTGIKYPDRYSIPTAGHRAA